MPRIHAADASVIALKLLEYIVSDEDALVRFLGLTGLAPEDLRRLAGDPAFHGAVLDHALQDEPLLLAFAVHVDLAPADVVAARRTLPGATQ